MFKRALALILFALALPLSVMAQDSPAPLETAVVEQLRIEYEGISFAFDSALADSVAVADYPAVNDDVQIPSPAFTEFTFDGYMAGDYLMVAPMPRIDVYAIEGFGDFPAFIAQLDELTRLLAERPDLNQYVATDFADLTALALPFLPTLPAAQVFRVLPQYIEVDGIRGIRYLVYFSQAPNPIEEGEVFYTFQGITSDGQHYVSLMLPVDTNAITLEAPTVDVEDFAAAYQQYLQDVVGAINATGGEGFSPSLRTLDALAQSVSVSR